jgi:hypothetical protein
MTLGVQEKQNLLKADRLKAVGLDLEAEAKKVNRPTLRELLAASGAETRSA